MMKAKKLNQERLAKVSESALLASVAASLKGRVLFPEKLESAKKYLKMVASSAL